MVINQKLIELGMSDVFIAEKLYFLSFQNSNNIFKTNN